MIIDHTALRNSLKQLQIHLAANYIVSHVRDQLEDLLGGKTVYLLDDVNRSGIPKYNALKFNLVDLQLVSNDQAKDKLLQQSLQSAMVSLTHMGESKYRCKQKFYTLSTQPQSISYSFLKENEEPVIKNHMYEKLRTGERLLSPFTLWAMQLSCVCVQNTEQKRIPNVTVRISNN